MKPKLIASIQIGPMGYGLYNGDHGLVWFGPPGPRLDQVHYLHADYQVNGRRDGGEDYEPDPIGAMVEYMASYLGGTVTQAPPLRASKGEKVY